MTTVVLMNCAEIEIQSAKCSQGDNNMSKSYSLRNSLVLEQAAYGTRFIALP